MGMAEQLLMSAAAGLAREGFVPLQQLMPCLHHAVLMTLFVWLLRKITSMSKLSRHSRV